MEILINLPWPAIPRKAFEVCSKPVDLDVAIGTQAGAVLLVLTT